MGPQEPQQTQYQPPATPVLAGQFVDAMPAPVKADDPGEDAAVTGMILAFFIPVVGLVFSILGLKHSRKAGQKNRLAAAGLIVSSVTTLLTVLALVLGMSMLISVSKKCSDLGAGTHYIDGTTKIVCE